MRRGRPLRRTATALLLLLALPAAGRTAGELNPREVLDRFDDLYRGGRRPTGSTAAELRFRSEFGTWPDFYYLETKLYFQ